MLTVELLKRYDSNANFRIIVKESPALAEELNTLPFTMFVARRLSHDIAWCVYGLPVSELERICGKNASLKIMIETVNDIGIKLTNEQYIQDVIPCDSETFKLYYY